jgi:hypothetical protein
MLIEMSSPVCGKHLSVLKETSYNLNLHFLLDDNSPELVGDTRLQLRPVISIAVGSRNVNPESGKSVVEETTNPSPPNATLLEIAAFKRVMWQWQETNEAGPQKGSKELNGSTADVVEDIGGSFPRADKGRRHFSTKPLHCTCGHFSFRSAADLQKHRLECHKVQWRCSLNSFEHGVEVQCGVIFNKESEFREHIRGRSHAIWGKSTTEKLVRDFLVQDDRFSVRFNDHHEVESLQLPPKHGVDLPLVDSFLERRKRHEKNEYFGGISEESDDIDSLDEFTEDEKIMQDKLQKFKT